MDRETLAAMLAEGRSIESIARETGRARVDRRVLGQQARSDARGTPPAHAARGGIEREQLAGAGRGRPVDPRRSPNARRVSARRSGTGCRGTNSRRAARYARRDAPKPAGSCASARATAGDRSCASEARPLPLRTLQHRGRAAIVAGASRRSSSPKPADAASLWLRRYVGALQFHHRDPATKAFEVSRQASWSRKRAARACLCGYDRIAGGPALPSRRSGREIVRALAPGSDALACRCPRRGGQVRAALLELPCGSRGRDCRSARVATTMRPGRSPAPHSGVAQSAEHSAVNRRVVGSSPTPRAHREPPPGRLLRRSRRTRAQSTWLVPEHLSPCPAASESRRRTIGIRVSLGRGGGPMRREPHARPNQAGGNICESRPLRPRCSSL